jgi:hypothetical protein
LFNIYFPQKDQKLLTTALASLSAFPSQCLPKSYYRKIIPIAIKNNAQKNETVINTYTNINCFLFDMLSQSFLVFIFGMASKNNSAHIINPIIATKKHSIVKFIFTVLLP